MPDRIRALYVDDEPGLLEVARLFLEQSPDFRVETAESAKVALNSPAISSCDAIISDYQMPGMDGIAFLKTVREKYGDMPFILFTGRGREEVVIEAINNGADFYLQKGGDPTAQFAELAHKIRQAVTRKRSQDELKAAYEQITASDEELRGQYEELAEGERRVRESQERYRSIIENSPYGMHFYELDPVRGLVFAGANPAADRILGIRHKELVGKTILEAFPGLAGTDIPTRYRGVAESGTPWQTEQVVYDKGEIHGAFSVTAFRPAQGSMAAMFLDITDRKRAEMERQVSEERLRTFLDSATDAFAIWDAHLNLVDMNRAALSYLPAGVTKEDVLGKNLEEFTKGGGEWESPDRYREIIRTGVPLIGTESITEIKGAKRWLTVKCFKVGDGLGIMTTDVTREKEAEEKLRDAHAKLTASEEELRQQYGEITAAQQDLLESRQQLAEIADTVPGVVYQTHSTPEGKEEFTFISSRVPDIFGISADREGFADRFFARVDPRDHEQMAASIRGAMKKGLPWEFEGRYLKPSGEMIWFQGLARPVQKASGLYYNGVLLDITARKTAEEALIRKTEELDQFFTASLDLFCIADTNGTFRRLNPEWERALGYPLAELEGHRFLDLVHPDDLPSTLAAVGDLSRQKNVLNFTNRYRHRDGSYRWIEWRSFPKGDLIFAAARDVTERRKMEDALRESEKRYHDLFERTKAVMLIVDRETSTIVDANAAACTYYGYTLEELRGMPIGAINMLETTDLRREMDRAASHDGLVFQFRHRKKNGEIRDVEVFSAPVTIGGRELLHSIVQDITERIRAEEALRSSEERLRIFIQQAPASMAMFDTDMHYLAASRRWITDYHLDDQDLAGRSHYEIFPELPEELKAIHRRALSGEVIASEEDRFIRQDGSVQWLAWEVRPWYTTGDTIGGIIIYSEDITARKVVEEALRESEEKYRSLVENASEAIFILRDRHLIYVNPRMAQLLGIPANNILEHSFLEFVWPEDRALLLDRYTRRMAGEDVVANYDFRMTGPEGKPLWVHISIAKVTWQGKLATLNLLTDITERKLAEASLKEAGRKLALLNGMTRHDIRNQLLTLQGFTQYAAKKVQDPDIAGYLAKIDGCAKTIREQIEFMKTYQELGVNSPSWYPLDGTVGKVCLKELPCRILCSGTEVFADPMLGKVFFNLFDNTRRHGENATEVVVRCEAKGDDLTIIVEDNGIGISDDEKEKVFLKGYGKNTGFGLFLVREILSITGITIRETGTRGKGARFEILVPRECWRKSGA